MSDDSLILFDTPLGRCGLLWGARGIKAATFAEGEDTQTVSRLMRNAPNAVEAVPTENVMRAIAKIRALFAGEPENFDEIEIDLAGVSEFDQSVLALTQEIPAGGLKTYGGLARALGDVSYSRRVGQALGRNPIPIIVPCHRVVGADGAMTGFSAPGGTDLKRQLLKIEGALEPDLFDAL